MENACSVLVFNPHIQVRLPSYAGNKKFGFLSEKLSEVKYSEETIQDDNTVAVTKLRHAIQGAWLHLVG
jgi:hypothetical protein